MCSNVTEMQGWFIMVEWRDKTKRQVEELFQDLREKFKGEDK